MYVWRWGWFGWLDTFVMTLHTHTHTLLKYSTSPGGGVVVFCGDEDEHAAPRLFVDFDQIQ